MLQLTPIEESVIGQELIQLGEQKGRAEGRKEGELIGEIRAMQKFLKRRVTPFDDLAGYSLNVLTAMLQDLEAELATFN